MKKPKERARLLPSKSKALALLFCHCGVLLAIIVSGLVVSTIRPVDQGDLYPASIQATALAVWMLWSWYALNKTLFDPYSLFMFSAILFNAGQAILECLNLNEHGILDGRFAPEITVQAIYLATLGLAGFHFGMMCSSVFRARPRRNGSAVPIDTEKLRLLGFSIIAVAIVPASASLVASIQAVVAYGYFKGIFQAQHAAGLAALPERLAIFLVPGALFLLAGSRTKLSGRVVSFVVVALFAVTNIFLGVRGSGVMALFAFAWLWHRCIRPLPRLPLLTGAALLFFVLLPVVSVVRAVGGGERLSSEAWVRGFTSIQNPAIAIISEMGSSLATLAYTIELVPTVRPFDFGTSFAYALFSAVPNVAWSIHPSVAHGLLGEWLIKTIDPTTAALGGGLGYSFIAEAYLNFGFVGAPMTLALIGFLVGRFFSWADTYPNVAKSALLGCFLSIFLQYARGESAGVVRGFIWYCLFPYLLFKLLAKRKYRRPQPLREVLHSGVQPRESRIY